MPITYVDPLETIDHAFVVFELGDVIRKLRKQRHWSLDDLAERSGVNRMSLSEIERGKVDSRASTIAKIAAGFGISVESLHTLRGLTQADTPAAQRTQPGGAGAGRSDQTRLLELEKQNRALREELDFLQAMLDEVIGAVSRRPQTGRAPRRTSAGPTKRGRRH